jgi:hypothetical protein
MTTCERGPVSTLAFWLLMVMVVAFVAALVGVGLAVRSLLHRAGRMNVELGELSNDISDIVGSGERG